MANCIELINKLENERVLSREEFVCLIHFSVTSAWNTDCYIVVAQYLLNA